MCFLTTINQANMGIYWGRYIHHIWGAQSLTDHFHIAQKAISPKYKPTILAEFKPFIIRILYNPYWGLLAIQNSEWPYYIIQISHISSIYIYIYVQ